MFATIIYVLLAAYLVRRVLRFVQNARLARQTGLPVIFFPFQQDSVIYDIVLETRLVKFLINNCLPSWLKLYVQNSTGKLRWSAKDRLRSKYGGIHIIATPSSLTCNVSDASVVSHIFTARRNFAKPVQQYKAIELYGTNVVTCTDQEWSHHRRHTATSFSEKNNDLVWKESIRQATEMIQHWKEEYSQGSPDEFMLISPREDILKFTLNVLYSAGFGVKLPFKPAKETGIGDAETLFRDAVVPPEGYHFTFRSVMEYMNQKMSTVFLANGVLPQWIPRGFLPFLRTDFYAYDDLGNYLSALVSRAQDSKSQENNLLEGMVNSQQSKPQDVSNESSTVQKQGLSDSEIRGNLYIFTVAGHETTATTMRFALVLLALDQDAQEALYKDILAATSDEPQDPAEWEYGRVFPKLLMPLCVMLETLRLFPPVVTVPKSTTNSVVNITYEGRNYCIPPNIAVNVNTNGLHYCEDYWGPDAEEFRPSRWDKRNSDSFLAKNDGTEGLSGPGLEYDTIHKPIRGAYVPFSDGFRACMGKKFAQVEFVVTLAVIFHDYHVTLAKTSQSDTMEDVRRRARQALQESSSFITLTMTDDVPLLFQKRAPASA